MLGLQTEHVPGLSKYLTTIIKCVTTLLTVIVIHFNSVLPIGQQLTQN